jgi:hypothetical protein
MDRPVWHGTPEEANDLADSVAHNCACDMDESGIRAGTCVAHQMLEDQRTLDRLVFARFMARRMLAHEFGVESAADADCWTRPVA